MKEKINLIVGLTLIGFIIYLGYLLVIWVIDTIDPQIAAAVLTGAFTILLSTISLMASRNYESKQKVKEENRMKKIPVYDNYMKFMFRVLDPNDVVKDKDIKKFAKEFNPDLLIWGSSDVVKKYSTYRHSLIEINANNSKTSNNFSEFEDLLLAIRKDLGHKDKNVVQNDLLKVFINDIEKTTN